MHPARWGASVERRDPVQQRAVLNKVRDQWPIDVVGGGRRRRHELEYIPRDASVAGRLAGDAAERIIVGRSPSAPSRRSRFCNAPKDYFGG
jgi:hypothetical protein